MGEAKWVRLRVFRGGVVVMQEQRTVERGGWRAAACKHTPSPPPRGDQS